MSANRGTAFLLKVGDGAPTPSYSTVAGLKTTNLLVAGDPVDCSAKLGWRELLSGGGKRSVSIAANGIFTGSAAETEIRGHALSGDIGPYELSFESGERLRGDFLITRLEYAGDFNGERKYTIALESSGEVQSL